MKVILETDRLFLREYVEEDAEAFFKLNSDPEVLRFVPDKRLLNVEQARQILVDHPIADYRKYGFGRGACIPKGTGEQIGFAGLKYLEEFGEVDVAFRLMRTHWGQGLATEAALCRDSDVLGKPILKIRHHYVGSRCVFIRVNSWLKCAKRIFMELSGGCV